jgi:hypothetical protein
MSKSANSDMRVYTFIARVHPERYGYNLVNLPRWTFTADDETRVASHRFQLLDSQMAILTEVNYEVSLLDLKNDTTRLASAVLDSLGFIISAALSLKIVACVDPSGQLHVFNTVFDGFREQGEGAQQREWEILNMLLPHALSSEVHLALSDLRRAISEPQDTVFHCYRAVETIRQEYVEKVNDKRDRDESWSRLRAAIGMPRPELDWLKSLSERRRHGQSVTVTHEMRSRAIKIAREVVYKHCVARSLDANVKIEFEPPG